MPAMSKFDHSDIDGRLLQVLLAVFEEQSVTRAAARLDVTQSAVSHLLDKLRDIVGDPLFVKSGRGIVATARAEALAAHARVLLDGLRSFAAAGSFDPATLRRHGHHRRQRPAARPAAAAAAAHRARACAGAGAAHHSVGRAQRRDAARRPLPAGRSRRARRRPATSCRSACSKTATASTSTPASAARRSGLDDYLASEHCSVHYEARRTLDIDEWIAAQGHRRRFAVTVPGFAGIGPFLRGSTRLATLPGLLRASLLRGLAVAPPPFDCPPMPMYMVWHLRHQADPMHQWLRQELQAVVAPALAAAELRPAVSKAA